MSRTSTKVVVMDLLQDIQEAAVDQTVPLAVLLRRCAVLASRLRFEPLKNWVQNELNGYPAGADVPGYRQSRAFVFADFQDSLGRVVRNVPVPHPAVHEKHWETVFHVRFADSIGALEDMLCAHNDPALLLPPEFAVVALKPDAMPNHVCISAYQSIGRSCLITLVDSVRTRVLMFTLEIAERYPSLGDDEPRSKVPQEVIGHVFYTTIFGGQNIVGTALATTMNQAITVDWDSLADALRSMGIGDDDVDALRSAVEADGDGLDEEGVPGNRVCGWLGRLTARVAAGTYQLGANVTAGVVTEAVISYLRARGKL
jgi:hypothetical protein